MQNTEIRADFNSIVSEWAAYKDWAGLDKWLEGAEQNEAFTIKKLRKKDAINAQKEELINSNITYKGHDFQAREKDRNLLTSAVALFSLQNAVPSGFKWIDAYNTAVDFSLDDLKNLAGLMANRLNEATLRANTAKNKITNARSQFELDKISF